MIVNMIRRLLAAVFICVCLSAPAAAQCPYNFPFTWYWTVQDNSPSTQVFNSATGAFVSTSDGTYVAWVAAGCATSNIATLASLYNFFDTFARGLVRPGYASVGGGGSITLTNPLAAITNISAIGAPAKVFLPLMNVPVSVPTGVPIYIHNGSGSNFDVYLSDATTQISTVADGETGVFVNVDQSQIGTWNAYVLPNVDPRNASNLNSGTTACARMPALTGNITTSAGSCSTTLAAGSASNLNSGTLPSGRLSGTYSSLTGLGTITTNSLTRGTQSYTSGNNTFTVPSNVFYFCWEAWSGGGGGGKYSAGGIPGSGGGAGSYASGCQSTTPGATFTANVGAGGTGSTGGNAATGGSTVFGSTTCSGGTGGGDNGAGAGGGQGCSGGSPVRSIIGKSGYQPAANTVAWGGDAPLGGGGGNTGIDAGACGAANIPGGGGGPGSHNGGSAQNGCDGGRGQINIYWHHDDDPPTAANDNWPQRQAA